MQCKNLNLNDDAKEMILSIKSDLKEIGLPKVTEYISCTLMKKYGYMSFETIIETLTILSSFIINNVLKIKLFCFFREEDVFSVGFEYYIHTGLLFTREA